MVKCNCAGVVWLTAWFKESFKKEKGSNTD
jgi:hypothetical protein